MGGKTHQALPAQELGEPGAQREGSGPDVLDQAADQGPEDIIPIGNERLQSRNGFSAYLEQLGVEIEELTTGYRASALADPRTEPSADIPLDLHRDFVARFGRVAPQRPRS